MLIIEKVTKTFGELQVLEEISVVVRAGEFVSLLGPSGSGKSSLFRIIAGLSKQDQGRITFNGSGLTDKPAQIGYMPQRDLLFPWKRLIDNIALPLIIAGVEKGEAYSRVQDLLPVFGLEGFLDYYPDQLSGGMKQRAALMRTVLIDSDLLLLDEPFASLDALTREQMQEWLLDIWQKFQPAIFFITHSIEEAIFLSDRIFLLSARPGKVLLNLEIDLPRPRVRDQVLSAKFLSYKEILLRSLSKGVSDHV